MTPKRDEKVEHRLRNGFVPYRARDAILASGIPLIRSILPRL